MVQFTFDSQVMCSISIFPLQDRLEVYPISLDLREMTETGIQ